MGQDIFSQETQILAAAKKISEADGVSSDAYTELVGHYSKLLRTTKKNYQAER